MSEQAPVEPTPCEMHPCTEPAIVDIWFVGADPTHIKVCKKHQQEICEQYKEMGKSGQISTHPLDPANPYGERVRTFTHKSRCPECKGLNTRALNTGKVKQYRRCLDCGKRYYEGGILI